MHTKSPTLLQSFCDEMEAFIARTGITPTEFGERAMNDGAFVFDLRAGRVPRVDTIDRVRAFMAARASASTTTEDAA